MTYETHLRVVGAVEAFGKPCRLRIRNFAELAGNWNLEDA